MTDPRFRGTIAMYTKTPAPRYTEVTGMPLNIPRLPEETIDEIYRQYFDRYRRCVDKGGARLVREEPPTFIQFVVMQVAE